MGYKKGNLKEGPGVLVCQPSGDIYSGIWKEGYLNGSGIVERFADKMTYEGQFKQSKMDGYGMAKWQDGTVYCGSYKEGAKDGEGVLRT